MSFRNRLTLFFVAIVIVPMVSVAFVLFSLIADNENGKADARIQARQQLAINLYASYREAGVRLAEKIGADTELATALRAGDDAAAKARSEALLREVGAVRLRIDDRQGERVDVGRADAVAPADVRLEDAAGSQFGMITVSDRSAPVYAREVKRLTGLDVVVRDGDRELATTLDGVPADRLPDLADVSIGDDEYRVTSFSGVAPGTTPKFGADLRISLLSSREELRADTARSRWLAGGVLAGFFLLAITCAILVSRSLQAQIAAFLDAARRLGRGDFSAKVPTQGRDEFAALGGEFNRMGEQLQHRLQELDTERVRLENAMRRLGDAFASNLDRDALLEIAVLTAVDGVDAEGGRAVLAGGDEVAKSGEPSQALAELVAAAEAESFVTGENRERTSDAGTALTHPLQAAGGGVVGSLSVWRGPARPFAETERDLFHYLANQAAVSLDNVALHETVQRQAVTDELTGLFNHRRFQEGLAQEIERARRFETGLGLVMLDIDNFKSVNDTYGHQVGDQVLAAVSDVLRDFSREIDEPARYGGEELAVVLPGTDLEGAYNLAERVRAGIEALDFPLGGGRSLQVTASFGAAALPESATDQSSLIAAADTALYQAKRSGKNRTVRAEPERARPGQ